MAAKSLPNKAVLKRIRYEMGRMFWAEMPYNDPDRSSMLSGATMRVFEFWQRLFYKDLTLEYVTGSA